jgi:uncharacterized protein
MLMRFFVVMLCGLTLTLAHADSSVWVAKSGNQTVYFAGTVHLLRHSDYPLPEEFTKAYDASTVMFFETDMAGMMKPGFSHQLLASMKYEGEDTLQAKLSTETYQALSQYCEYNGVPLWMLNRFKPAMLYLTLLERELRKMQVRPQDGVDMVYFKRAQHDGRTIRWLESIEEQIGFLSALGQGNEEEFVRYALAEVGNTQDTMNALIHAWRHGDADKLNTYVVDEMREKTLDVYQSLSIKVYLSKFIYQSLLVERNERWLPVLMQLFSGGNKTTLVMVGVGHLVGEDGILHRLQQSGIVVQQL